MNTVSKIFSSNGPLAANLKRYEKRSAQVEMAKQVECCIEQGGVLLAEAGTGTGKTLAYLVPSITLGRKVVISTGTKNLQEQIFFKDLAFLENALQISVKSAYLKGQDNYLCKNRLNQFLNSPRCLSYSSEKVAQLNRWANQTTSGDRMEITGLSDDSPIWREVCSTKETRLGQKCAFFDECFVTKARRAAMFADIVVVNHHLYFADLATRQRGGSILPSHDVVIFDEAHLIEDIATEFFGIKISSARLERTLNDTILAVSAAKFTDDPYVETRKGLQHKAVAASSGLFEMYRGPIGRSHLNTADIDAVRTGAYHKLDASLEAFYLSIKALEGRDSNVDHCANRLEEIREDLAQIIEGRDQTYVYWVESKPRSVILGASPIDISHYFQKDVLFARETVILASATLSTGGNFKFFKSRLGIDFEVGELSVAAPFDYSKQACLYVPESIPNPKHEYFIQTACDEVFRLLTLTNGGALILCTSIKSMNALYDNLLGRVDWPLLIQGEAPKSTLISQYLAEPNSVLVATTSFWQGVDIPGDALRLVIIDKLPFASPGDPVTSARIEHLQKNNQNPFITYQVPQAALSLKQGFGRLIRTAFDRGIVAILDNRLHTMKYATTFLQSLPPCPTVHCFEDALKWWKTTHTDK